MTMRGWVNLLKGLVITLAPIYVTTFLLLYFGFKIESILASILFVQIYVLVVQAEAMFRQAEWSRAAYDAVFAVSADVRSEATIITVANTGDKPAYNFFVGFRNDTQDKPLEHSRISMGDRQVEEAEPHMLSSGRRQHFRIPLSADEFRKQRIVVTIGYENILGHLREVRAASFENSESFFMLPFEERPGFLTRSYEDLALFIRSYRYRKWATKREAKRTR